MRLGAILFLRRIFPHLFPHFLLLLGTSIAYGMGAIVTPLVICKPIRASWDSTVAGLCGDQALAYVSLEVIALVLDVVIIVGPLVLIRRLPIPWKNKVMLGIVLSLGSLSVPPFSGKLECELISLLGCSSSQAFE